MPTVKTSTAPKAKAAPKADPKESAKGAAAAEKAARLKVIESQVPALVKLMSVMRERSKAADLSQKAVCQKLIAIVKEHSFTKEETRKLVVSAIAEVYCDGEESEVSAKGNGTAYSLVSRIVRVANPVNPKAAKETDIMLDSEDFTFSQCVSAAKGDLTSKSAKKKTTHGGARKPSSAWIEDADSFGDQFAALVKKGWNGEGSVKGYEGGLDLDEMEGKIAEVIAGFRAKAEGDGEEEKAE